MVRVSTSSPPCRSLRGARISLTSDRSSRRIGCPSLLASRQKTRPTVDLRGRRHDSPPDGAWHRHSIDTLPPSMDAGRRPRPGRYLAPDRRDRRPTEDCFVSPCGPTACRNVSPARHRRGLEPDRFHACLVCQRRLKSRARGGAKDCRLGWWAELGVRLGFGDAARGVFGGSGQRSHAELKRPAPAARPQGGMVCRVGVSLATWALEARCRPGPSDGVPQFSYRRCFCGRGSG